MKYSREDIIIMAILEFSNQHYDLASTNSIVKKLKISKGTLFNYFKTKQLLYEACVDYVLNEFEEFMALKLTNDVKENIILYASKEYDYLIQYPTSYKFFRNMHQVLNTDQFEGLKARLLNKSRTHLEDIYQNRLSDFEKIHIEYVLNGYMTEQLNRNQCKSSFLEGLNRHLEEIKCLN
jgi:AcrR family transcriptional regulator